MGASKFESFVLGVPHKKMGTFSLRRALETLPNDERTAASARVAMVHAAQERLGMEPRDDSILTFKYATNQLEDEDVPSAIASELFIVDRIHKETPYSSIIEDVLRDMADFVRRKYRLDWTTTWQIVRFYGPTMLKLYCVKHSQTIASYEPSASP